MQKLADRCLVLNQGQQGHHVELHWRFARWRGRARSGPRRRRAANARAHGPEPIIRPLRAPDAIHLARLMYRSYGYSYVNPDMYIAERILARVDDGRLTSWVAAVPGEAAPVGHIAFMKATVTTTRWKLAPPWWRRSSAAAGCWARCCPPPPRRCASARARDLRARRHGAPFTQKTFGRLGYLPTAAAAGLHTGQPAPESIGARPTGERGSVYYACKLLRLAAPQPVYLPEALQPLVLPRAHDIGVAAAAPALPAAPLKAALTCRCRPSLRSTPPSHAAPRGADLAPVLCRTLRQLCRARRRGVPGAWTQASAPPAPPAPRRWGWALLPPGSRPSCPGPPRCACST